MDTHTTPSQQGPMLPGGWSEFGPLDARSTAVFAAAMKGLLGVHYTPKQVSTQIVAGTNYRYRCDAKVVSPHSEKFTATVEIFQPLHGEPVITKIVRTSAVSTGPGAQPGGWTAFGPIDAQSRAVFDVAIAGLTGVGYKPLEVSTQIVAGKKYRFLCDATVVTLHASTYKAMVNIFEPLNGKPFITGIDGI